jgi:hypothetical protein
MSIYRPLGLWVCLPIGLALRSPPAGPRPILRIYRLVSEYEPRTTLRVIPPPAAAASTSALAHVWTPPCCRDVTSPSTIDTRLKLK